MRAHRHIGKREEVVIALSDTSSSELPDSQKNVGERCIKTEATMFRWDQTWPGKEYHSEGRENKDPGELQSWAGNDAVDIDIHLIDIQLFSTYSMLVTVLD